LTLCLRNYTRFPPSPIRITPSLAIAIIIIIIIISIVIRAEGAQHTTSITISIRAEGAQHTTSTTILTVLISFFSILVL
jgi:hypothetical protein